MIKRNVDRFSLKGSRETVCGKKKRHSTLEQAQSAIPFTKSKNRLKAYKCDYCEGFHIGGKGRAIDQDGESTHYKTRRAECVSCGRLLAIQNRGMCVTCCRKARKERGTALPPVQYITPLTDEQSKEVSKIWLRLVRYGIKLGNRWDIRQGYVDDCGSEVLIGAIDAILNGAPISYLPFLFTKGRDRLIRCRQSGIIPGKFRHRHKVKGPKSTTGRRYKGTELLFSELHRNSEVDGMTDEEWAELSGRIIA